jgi:hypothetical protein
MEKRLLTPRVKQGIFIWIVIAICYITVWLIPAFTKYSGQGEGSAEALAILRDGAQFKWYVIPLFLVVLHFYVDEIRMKNWSAILAGLAFFLMDAFNEIWNGLFFTGTNRYAGVWMCSFPTAYESLIGWNIEIMFMFLILGLASTKLLPKDKDAKVFGIINNRHFFGIVFAWICVVVEIILNSIGALIWNYWWWDATFPWLIFVLGYLPFFMIAYVVYDLPKLKHQILVVSIMAALVLVSLLVFIPLRWI